MTIDKYTSIKPIVSRVYGDTGYQFEIPHEDLILWTVEAMELIGYPLTYIPKVYGYKQDSDYEFTSYRVPLPCDFHKLQAIVVDGYPAYYRSNTMHHLLDGKCCGYEGLDSSIEDLFFNNFDANKPFSPQAPPVSGVQTSNSGITTFDINDSYITFNIPKGNACIAYWAFPVDEEGFPMIPDDAKYKRAIQDYLIHKVDYRLWRQDLISDKVYKQSEANWLWSIASVGGHLKMPSLDQMELLKNSLTRLIPRFHSYQNFFKDQAINKDRL